jgi:hypothetical protein
MKKYIFFLKKGKNASEEIDFQKSPKWFSLDWVLLGKSISGLN